MNIYQKIHLNVLLYPHGYNVRLLLTNELVKSHTEWITCMSIFLSRNTSVVCLSLQ